MNTAIFSVVHAILLNPLPFPESNRIVTLSEYAPGADTNLVSPITFEDWNLRSDLFEALSAFRFWENRSIQIDGGELYVPFSEMPMPFLTLVAKTKLPQESTATTIRRVIRGMSTDLALHNLMPLEEVVYNTISTRRLALALLLLFSALGLVLAAIGIYGVVTYLVEQRAQEIGIRMALGATPGSILLLIVRSNLRVIATAILAGLLVAAIATRTLTTLLYEVSAGDLSIYLGVCAVAFVVALFATCVPTVRAAAIDPVQALRKD